MHIISCALLTYLLMLSTAVSTEKASSQSNKDQLTDEQIAIYREVLMDITKDRETDQVHALKVAKETVGLNYFNVMNCFKDESVRNPDKENELKELYYLTQGAHILDASIISNLRAILIDRAEQMKIFEEIPRLVQNKDNYSRQEFDRKLKDLEAQEAQAGFITFSEILFWKERQYAFVAYSYYCAPLCGGGWTYIIKKGDGKWKISSKCGRTMS
jgi:hypothetical protein